MVVVVVVVAASASASASATYGGRVVIVLVVNRRPIRTGRRQIPLHITIASGHFVTIGD
jgi:hypothetical protein